MQEWPKSPDSPVPRERPKLPKSPVPQEWPKSPESPVPRERPKSPAEIQLMSQQVPREWLQSPVRSQGVNLKMSDQPVPREWPKSRVLRERPKSPEIAAVQLSPAVLQEFLKSQPAPMSQPAPLQWVQRQEPPEPPLKPPGPPLKPPGPPTRNYRGVRTSSPSSSKKPSRPINLPKPQPEPVPESPESPESLGPPELPEFPESLESPWRISISEKFDQGRQYDAGSYHWAQLSIYRVPKPVRDVDETAYTPQIVAVGPYHREQSHLCDMERHKWRALHRAVHREGLGFDRYLEVGRSLEFRARACYEAYLFISPHELVESLVIDAIFVLELFRGVYNNENGGFPGLGYDPNDPVFTVPGIMLLLQRDMIKLENQLPFFVLDNILALQKDYKPDLLARLALTFFNNLMPSNTRRLSGESFTGNALHCLDFFRHNLILEGPETPGTKQVDNMRYLNHSVTELRAAGFKFRSVESVRFWDIKFKNGILYIPRLQVHDTTKSLFLNLIAFEQYHLKCDRHISTYVIFMDRLINSDEDVRFLHHKRIIEHFLGNDGEVADLFNLLCKDVTFNIEECYLSDLFKHVNIYYNRRWNTWRASFVQKYVNNPWTIISLVAAIILLLLTFAQTFYGIYSYYKPN